MGFISISESRTRSYLIIVDVHFYSELHTVIVYTNVLDHPTLGDDATNGRIVNYYFFFISNPFFAKN